MGMGKRAFPTMQPFRPSGNPRWNRHHRIQRGGPLQKTAETGEAMQTRGEEMEEMEVMPEEEEEMVELMKKRSGLALPTPNVEDAGMLMGMGKRTTGTKEFALDGGLPS